MRMKWKWQLRTWRRVLESSAKKTVFHIINVAVNLLIAAGIVLFIANSSVLFRGSDSMYHVYRGDWVLTSIEGGDKWPLYNPLWYNGVELMRYWPPAAAYLMAFCHYIARSLPSVFTGHYTFGGFAVYCGVIYLIGSLAWNVVGAVKKRPVMGAVIGALWFFMPQSIYVMFGEGNLPRVLIMSIFPLALLFLNEYLRKGGRRNYIGIAVTFFLMCCCHVGYTGMVAIACIIYLVVYRLCIFTGSGRLQKGNYRDIEIVTAVIAGFLICGIFLIPAVKGGLVSNSDNTDQTARMFFQSVIQTIDPVAKIRYGSSDNYFGLISFLLCLFGMIAGKRRSWPGFITAMIIVLLTSDVCFPVITSLPGGNLMWMLRFLQIASAMVLFSMLEWDSLKKPLTVLVTSLLFLDAAVSYKTFVNEDGIDTVEGYFELLEEDTLIAEAKEMTVSRMALIDSGRPVLNAVYYLTDYDGGVNELFGQGWEAASTSLHIAQINEAFDTGYYLFMFDRLREMGCDTVLVRKDAAAVYMFDQDEADEAAYECRYDKVADEGNYVLYHLSEVTGTYGTVTDYTGLAIGNGAYYITMMFPAVQEAPSDYIDDFTAEELSSYDIIYLDGFVYHDVDAAEALITEAAENGTRVFVLADGIPENYRSRTYRFLGVECNPIQFDNGYPTLKTRKWGDFEVALFPDEHRNWRTVYMNGLDEVEGWSDILDDQFPFYGTAVNENITFIGFNLTYYYALTRDVCVGELLAGIVDTSIYEAPDRRFVPIDITYDDDSITVYSPETNVNTSLAWHDIFEGDFETLNRLVYVDEGTTVITMHYPYLKTGIAVSFAGVLMAGLVCYYIGRKNEGGSSWEAEKAEQQQP